MSATQKSVNFAAEVEQIKLLISTTDDTASDIDADDDDSDLCFQRVDAVDTLPPLDEICGGLKQVDVECDDSTHPMFRVGAMDTLPPPEVLSQGRVRSKRKDLRVAAMDTLPSLEELYQGRVESIREDLGKWFSEEQIISLTSKVCLSSSS